MRLAYLINRYPAVSHSFIRREIHALERLNHQVLRIALRGWAEELSDVTDETERKLTRYVLDQGPLPLAFAFIRVALTRPRRLSATLRLVWKIGRRAERPLIVHLIYLFEACRVLNWLKVEGIEHLHAHFGTNSAVVAMLVHSLGGPSWSFTAHGPEEFDKAQMIALAEKIQRASFVVAVSSFGRSQLFRQVTHDQWNKIEVVHCGIESTFYRQAVADGALPARLVCVGRLCEQKGQALLLDAAQRLAARGVMFELVLAGDGELRGAIEALIARYDLQDKVRITGWIGGDRVRDELAAARALVLPSFAEGLPVVIMEAMALRRPVISTFVAGIPELVVPGEHGWLVPAGDTEALADAMQACLDAPAEILESFGTAGYHRVRDRHDIDKEAAKLADHFQTAIAQSAMTG
jgi:glycosyltransferase involved in cell wall biosynthesis